MSTTEVGHYRVVHRDKTTGAITELEGHSTVDIELAVDGTPTQITVSIPNNENILSTGRWSGKLVANPSQFEIEVLWYDDLTNTETVLARGDLKEIQGTDKGNPTLTLVALGLLYRLQFDDKQSYAGLTDPKASYAVQNLALQADSLTVDVSGFTDYTVNGWVDLTEINPISKIQELIAPSGAELFDDTVNRKIVVRQPLGLGASVLTIARGSNLMSLSTREGQVRPYTALRVNGQTINSGDSSTTTTPTQQYGEDTNNIYRETSNTSTIETLQNGLSTSKFTYTYAMEGTAGFSAAGTYLTLQSRDYRTSRYVATAVLEASVVEGSGFSIAQSQQLTDQLETTIGYSGNTPHQSPVGRMAMTTMVRTRWDYDTTNMPSVQTVETWSVVSGRLCITSRVITTYTWIAGASTSLVETWAIVNGRLSKTGRVTNSISDSPPATEGKTTAISKIFGTYTSTDATALAKWGTIYGTDVTNLYVSTTSQATSMATKLVQNSVFDASSIDVTTPFTTAIALGDTVTVTDAGLNINAPYYVRYMKIHLSPGKYTLELPKLVPGVS